MTSSISIDFLSAPSTLSCVFAPTGSIKLNTTKPVSKLYKDNGAEFTFKNRQLAKTRFYYLGIAGHTPQFNLFWAITEVTAADAYGELNTAALMCIEADSHKIDDFLIDFFGVFPQKRFMAPIKEPNGTLQDLLTGAAIWFNGFSTLYLDEITTLLTQNKRKRIVDRKKKKD